MKISADGPDVGSDRDRLSQPGRDRHLSRPQVISPDALKEAGRRVHFVRPFGPGSTKVSSNDLARSPAAARRHCTSVTAARASCSEPAVFCICREWTSSAGGQIFRGQRSLGTTLRQPRSHVVRSQGLTLPSSCATKSTASFREPPCRCRASSVPGASAALQPRTASFTSAPECGLGQLRARRRQLQACSLLHQWPGVQPVGFHLHENGCRYRSARSSMAFVCPKSRQPLCSSTELPLLAERTRSPIPHRNTWHSQSHDALPIVSSYSERRPDAVLELP